MNPNNSAAALLTALCLLVSSSSLAFDDDRLQVKSCSLSEYAGLITVLESGWVLPKDEKEICTQALSRCYPIIDSLYVLERRAAELDRKVNEDAERIEFLERRLREKESALQAVLNSRSWRYTQWIRDIFSFFRSI